MHADFRRFLAGLCLLLLTIPLSGCGSPPAPQVVAAPIPPDAELRQKLDEIIDYTGNSRFLDAQRDSAWQVVHGVLPYGYDYKVRLDGELIPALPWLLQGADLGNGKQLKGWRLVRGEKGLDSILEPGSMEGQGHPDQWLGYLSQCGLTLDDQIVVGGETYTVRDMVEQAKWDVADGDEATWTLMALNEYVPVDESWQAKDGSTWNLERLVGKEVGSGNLARETGSASCGGCHRMYSIAKAVNRYRAQLQPGQLPTPTWQKATEMVQQAIRNAHDFRQPDGSFSTGYFVRPGSSDDLDKQIHSTGHILEFLTVAMTDEQLNQPWVTQAVVRLHYLLDNTRDLSLNFGSLYHAANALIKYRARRFGASAAPATAFQAR